MAVRSTFLSVLCAATLLAPASALGARSVGSAEQIAWVRRAAGNFVAAELAGNGASACGILNAPMRASERDRTCAQRWDARLARMLRQPGARASLRAEQRAIPSAVVVVDGEHATIALPAPLLAKRPNRLLFTESCWMVAG